MQEFKVLPESILAPIWRRKYYQRVPQSEELPGSVTIKRISRKCNNQKYFQEVSHSKVLSGSAAIMGTARQYHIKCIRGVLQTKVRQGSVTIKSTARECHQGVSKSKVLPGTATIKCTARDRQNQKYCQGMPK